MSAHTEKNRDKPQEIQGLSRASPSPQYDTTGQLA
jgi:hypothetical protein